VPDLFSGPEHLRQHLASRVLPAELQASFAAAHEHMAEQIGKLKVQLEHLDHTLVDAASHAGSKMLYQINRLRGRAARAEIRRNQEIARHADGLSSALYPNKDLQERVFPGAIYVARYGEELLEGLLGQLCMECPDHQLIFL
jgi:hypothetical protein